MRHIFFHIEERAEYPRRIALCTVLSLVVAIAVFRFWPNRSGTPADGVFDTRGQELISMEEILPTRQQRRAPPPPAPVPPVIVPDDVVLPDVEIEISDDLLVADAGVDTGDAVGVETPASGTSTRPDAGPRPVRFVEPEYTDAARKQKIRAEIVVEVLVDSRGRVSQARVTDRFLIRDRDSGLKETVAMLGFGLEESALDAARQWMFRPARQGGKIVDSWTTLTFSFGL